MLITLSTVESPLSLADRAVASAAVGARISIVYGFVTGLLIRSLSVRIASVFGFLVCSGLESKLRNGAATIPDAVSRPNTIKISSRYRATSGSSGTAQAKPTTLFSPRGRNRVMAAGRKQTVQVNAISMPTPAIRPSSATPMKAVGTKARKPAAVARAATRIWRATRDAVWRIASAASGNANRRSR